MIDRTKCRLDNLIDKPFGFEYEMKEQQFELKPHAVDDKNRVEIVKDNRNLLDQRDNQKLTKDEIDQMRNNDDISGTVKDFDFILFLRKEILIFVLIEKKEIIDALIENSASFHTKTEYSQEKYIKKKKEK